jgi:hypothetical protein
MELQLVSEQSHRSFILDTSAINWIADRQFGAEYWKGFQGRLFITHVQLDEIERTSNQVRREQLLAVTRFVQAAKLPTHTPIWDDVPWDESFWPKDDRLYESILDAIVMADIESKKRSNQKLNRSRDARIVETAIRDQLVLVTTDPEMHKVTLAFGGTSVQPEELLNNR